ncbi:hypothetical protein Mgra_00003985 [Meloidogyne graminicola]|uniref:Uncharacterized protein n=1 Tax=Meloidogyne graminicola TaxID=189291 RepID=A0A8S9ZUC3_9BILA|nr:hypothetical protein Mgra_00003985 [Meloidogyne graminicola]
MYKKEKKKELKLRRIRRKNSRTKQLSNSEGLYTNYYTLHNFFMTNIFLKQQFLFSGCNHNLLEILKKFVTNSEKGFRYNSKTNKNPFLPLENHINITK